MKFAFVSTMAILPWGGSEDLWSQTAVQLKEAGHDVQAWVVRWPQLANKITALARQGIRLETYSGYRLGVADRIRNNLTFRSRRSYSRLKRFKPDLVIISQAHNSGGFRWAKICREASVPYVLIVHCNSEQWWFDDRQLEEAAASYRSAQKVFCVSHGNLRLLRMQLADPMQNGEVVRNPCKVCEDNIAAWPIENGQWRLACVGRLDLAAKGQDLLLQVLARPEWRARPIELSIFGEGPHEFALRRLASMLKLSNVHFRGHVSDIGAIWEQNHLLVLPSRYEGLPLVLVEAMWCGRPAVVTDVAGNTEVCIDNETGFVAPAPTVALLADTLQRAWDRREDWQRMGMAARARAESQIPRDPIPMFADRLRSCADAARQASGSTKPS